MTSRGGSIRAQITLEAFLTLMTLVVLLESIPVGKEMRRL